MTETYTKRAPKILRSNSFSASYESDRDKSLEINTHMESEKFELGRPKHNTANGKRSNLGSSFDNLRKSTTVDLHNKKSSIRALLSPSTVHRKMLKFNFEDISKMRSKSNIKGKFAVKKIVFKKQNKARPPCRQLEAFPKHLNSLGRKSSDKASQLNDTSLMTEKIDRPPTRQRPPPQSLHLFRVGRNVNEQRVRKSNDIVVTHFKTPPSSPIPGMDAGLMPSSSDDSDSDEENVPTAFRSTMSGIRESKNMGLRGIEPVASIQLRPGTSPIAPYLEERGTNSSTSIINHIFQSTTSSNCKLKTSEERDDEDEYHLQETEDNFIDDDNDNPHRIRYNSFDVDEISSDMEGSDDDSGIELETSLGEDFLSLFAKKRSPDKSLE